MRKRLYIKDNIFIITGSNVYLLSGKFIDISLLPLSFSEFCNLINSSESKENLFDEYLRDGAFPYVAVADNLFKKIDVIYT